MFYVNACNLQAVKVTLKYCRSDICPVLSRFKNATLLNCGGKQMFSFFGDCVQHVFQILNEKMMNFLELLEYSSIL